MQKFAISKKHEGSIFTGQFTGCASVKGIPRTACGGQFADAITVESALRTVSGWQFTVCTSKKVLREQCATQGRQAQFSAVAHAAQIFKSSYYHLF